MNTNIGKGDIIFWLLLAIAVLVGFGFLAGRTNKRLEAQVHDLQVQLSHASIPLEPDTIRDSIPVVTQRVVEVDKTDYKSQIADRELIKDLEMKVSRIEAENVMLRQTLGSVLLHPILVSVAAIIGILVVSGIPNNVYQQGMKPFSWLMTPATVCLAVPLYEQVKVLPISFIGHIL